MAGPADERDRLTRRLCELLIAAREAADLNQTQLGKALGRSQSFVSNYERGQRRLAVPEFVQITRALGQDPVAFLGSFLKSH